MAAWRTGGGGREHAAELHPFGGELVEVRRVNVPVAGEAQVSPVQVVGDDEQQVWPLGREDVRADQREEAAEQ
jgi:hypothetical protein